MNNQPDEKLYEETPYGNSTYKLRDRQNEKKYPTEINYQYKQKTFERWFQNGVVKRDNDEPSYTVYTYNDISRDNTPHCIDKMWMIGDKITRNNDNPARILYYGDDKKEREFWMINGKYHRDNGLPADIYYDKNGIKRREIWMKNNKKYRGSTQELKNPASWIEYHEDGKIACLKWYKNNKLHRRNGFAIIYCNENSDSHGENHINGNYQSTVRIEDIRQNNDYIAHVEAGINRDRR